MDILLYQEQMFYGKWQQRGDSTGYYELHEVLLYTYF